MSIAQPEFTTHYLSMGNMAEGHLTVTNKILPDPYNVQPQFYYTIWSEGNGDSNKRFLKTLWKDNIDYTVYSNVLKRYLLSNINRMSMP